MTRSSKLAPRRTATPSAEELALFRAVMKGVRPLDARSPPASAPTLAPPERAIAAAPARATAKTGEFERTAPAPNPGIDRRTLERLRRGELPIEATIDLHGMTAETAHRALDRFIDRAAEDGRRLLLVITGKGGIGEGAGVLRRELPRWLGVGANAMRVLAFTPARPKHGGAGAWYVLLRRRRA
jgi:DNA-nicking Smr family endonuclease